MIRKEVRLQVTGRPDLASNDYVAALRLDPKNAAIRFNLGNALRQMGYLEEADILTGWFYSSAGLMITKSASSGEYSSPSGRIFTVR